MHKKLKPGLGAFYDFQPGNESGLLLQPGSLHGADIMGACLSPQQLR